MLLTRPILTLCLFCGLNILPSDQYYYKTTQVNTLKIHKLYCTIHLNQLQKKYCTNEWVENTGNVAHKSHLLTISLGFAQTVKHDCSLYISNSAHYGEQRLCVL